ncbi:metallophosphoesterase [Halogeometricum limi]|uniref:Calcineurin-like phosphoesterase n=1 Tax=Halogeometricum limi TaxID=555875 RepID=A0A1I6HGF1_9EURY|nr:metallophosphoesterase [Halogeometricum limi]SFR53586.1 Calcineurin-like phosphoesterase [Halogeometricum limi]
MGSGNELTELYDSLSVLYGSLPSGVDSEWRVALRSVLYGGDLLASEASCYGAQQKERNLGKRKDYARRHGNGDRVTEFSAITVAETREEDHRYVPAGAKLPLAPESGEVLPVNVSPEEVDWAISLLAEFPAEPAADRPGDGGDVLLDRERVHRARQATGAGDRGDETTVLFVSDTHLGYENRAETGSGKTVSWIGEIDSRDTIRRIRTIAMERDVDAVIHTGDVLDHEVDAVTLDAAESSLRDLALSGIPVYCILGTHDHNAAIPYYSNSVDGVAWLKDQVRNEYLIELSSSPMSVAGGPLDAYGVSAENVGLDDVGKYESLGWRPSEIAFGAASPGPNVLCLHDGVTPYRNRSNADVDLDELLAQSRVSFDCVLVGDEHRPKYDDFDTGYSFETEDGTPVLYTGPAARVGPAYRDNDAFVTELSISDAGVTTTRHSI